MVFVFGTKVSNSEAIYYEESQQLAKQNTLQEEKRKAWNEVLTNERIIPLIWHKKKEKFSNYRFEKVANPKKTKKYE